MSRRAPRCPDCPGAPVGVPLVFGLPSAEAFEAAERGELVLGGCVMDDGPTPRWGCPRCGSPLRREGSSGGGRVPDLVAVTGSGTPPRT